ncbi:glycosyltransferase, partial [bacterium]
MNPRASVVIPTYRRPELLERCLGMLLVQETAGMPFEIIVADDAADPQTKALVERKGSLPIPVRYVP